MTRANTCSKYLEVSAALEAQVRGGRWDGGRMPSVRGVARQHGVSVVTASRAIQVLRDKGLIQTIERAGCFRVPDPTAERWALVFRLTPGPWQRAISGVTRAGFDAMARREPMHLESDLFPLTPSHAERDILPLVRSAKERGVGGVFLLPSRHSEEEMRLDERFLTCCEMEELPVVLIERNLRGQDRLLRHDLVAMDDVDGAARCTKHLIDLGRKRIAAVVASPTSSHNNRVAGYLYGLYASPLANRKQAERKPIVLYQDESLPSREAYAKLADQVRKLNVDGVVCYHDYTAMGLIFELLARGMSVPEDVAVVGFYDLPIGTSFNIGVTTHAYPSEGIAEQAIRMMRERLREPGRAPTKVVVPGRLIVRESSAGK
jgi:LacI family transcriptional regulator